ncbi:MAG: hypothetical protein H6719_17580 [Sandaracinaceae bacterium]|nr:hypothetical protein [Sandaracinaceae bacterium]
MTPVEELPPREEARRPTHLIVSIAVTVAVGVESFILAGMGRSIAGMYEDFEARLPFLTRLFLTNVGYGFAIGLCLVGVTLALAGWLRRSRPLEVAGIGVTGAVAAGLPILAMVGFYQPLWQLADNIR